MRGHLARMGDANDVFARWVLEPPWALCRVAVRWLSVAVQSQVSTAVGSGDSVHPRDHCVLEEAEQLFWSGC